MVTRKVHSLSYQPSKEDAHLAFAICDFMFCQKACARMLLSSLAELDFSGTKQQSARSSSRQLRLMLWPPSVSAEQLANNAQCVRQYIHRPLGRFPSATPIPGRSDLRAKNQSLQRPQSAVE